ncbi:MAG: DUF4340 domain-containing protein, partial [Verrucomicrobiota bacterium]|nr:DUF4340 domain-containing protein [Verrucomicrobiota bacterium]
MKFRSTLILLLLAAGLFAYIWFVERNRPTTREAREQSQRVAKIDRDEFDAISIKSPEDKLELRKKDNVWFLEEPVKDRADSMAINQLFTTVETLKHDAAIGADGKAPTKEQIREFGLGDPDTKVRFAGKDKRVEFEFGKDAAVEGKVYLKIEDKSVVYVVGSDFKNQVAKKADEFRDKKLTDLSTGLLTKAIIKTAQGEIELEKKDKHWQITRPLNARGDDAKIGDVLSQATTARIESFVADSANLSAYGLQEPRGTVTLYSEGSEQPAILQIGTNPGDEKDKEKTYAKLSTRDSVVLLPKSIESLLETKPNDLRDKSLVRVESDIVDRIIIEAPGKEKIVLARSGETWVRKTDKDLPINAPAANKLLTTLQTQQVASFVADVATDLPKYGLDQPQRKVTLSSYASENTAETKAGEMPIVTILFGKVEGENVYAKLDEEPFIVSVNEVVLQDLYTDPLQW